MSFSVSSIAVRLGAVIALAGALAGCVTDNDVTGSIMKTSAARDVSSPEARDARWRQLSASYGAAFEKNPSDPAAAYGYGLALRALGQRAQALAVLEGASIKHPQQKQILAAYGRALSDVGRYDEALAVLQRAHTPESPDWRILNAQGAILDQVGRSGEARGYYEAALKIAPGDPSILSNLGLSYALANDLANAEIVLAQAAASPGADSKVTDNLALVRGLKAGGAKGLKPARNARPAA